MISRSSLSVEGMIEFGVTTVLPDQELSVESSVKAVVGLEIVLDTVYPQPFI